MPLNVDFQPITQERLRNAMADLPAGVSMITTIDNEGRPRGATVSAVTSLSLEPALVLVCLDQGSDTLAVLSEGRQFLLHIASEGQQGIAYALAGKGDDKFDRFDWRPEHGGLPFIGGCALAFLCTVDNLLPGGDHTIVVGRIEQVAQDEARVPIVYHRRQMVASPVAVTSAA